MENKCLRNSIVLIDFEDVEESMVLMNVQNPKTSMDYNSLQLLYSFCTPRSKVHKIATAPDRPRPGS